MVDIVTRAKYIYMCSFVLSFVLIWSAQRFLSPTDVRRKLGVIKVKNDFGILLLGIGLLIPCVLAALRATSVGQDVSIYVMPGFYMVQRGASFAEMLDGSGLEILYAAMLYICSKYANIQVFFFVSQLLVIFPVGIVLYRKRNHFSIAYGMILYYLLFYNISLCIMRQSIAMSFLLLTYELWDKREYKKSIITLLLACLVHNSAIVISMVFLIIFYIRKTKNKNKFYCAMLLVLGFVFFYYQDITSTIAKLISYISTRYAYYIYFYAKSMRNYDNIPMTDLLCKTVVLLLPITLLLITKKLNSENESLVIFVLIGRYFVLFTALFYESMRVAYFFDYFIIVLLANVFITTKGKYLNRFLIGLICIVPAYIYWSHYIMGIGAYYTNEYIFYWENVYYLN